MSGRITPLSIVTAALLGTVLLLEMRTLHRRLRLPDWTWAVSLGLVVVSAVLTALVLTHG